MLARRIIAVLAIALLAGCSANHYSIFRNEKLEKPSVTLIDAKQRAILAGAPLGTDGQGLVSKFCAEPSPDVFAVVAQALSGGATLEKGADPRTIQAALSAAFSSAEQGSTIPRTQTINMLREVMYRTCERYLSGGISDIELPLQAIRDQRLIVSILAIEQLTGAITPKPVVIGASAAGSGGASNADVALRLDDRFKDLQGKIANEEAKQKAFDELNGTAKDCETIAKAVADNKTDGLTDALKTKRPKCEAASADLKAAKTQRTDAASHYEKLASVAKSGGVPVSTSTSLMTPVAGGGLDSARAAEIAEVAGAVQRIVTSTFDQDEFLFLCLKALTPNSDSKVSIQAQAPDLAGECIKYIQSKVELQRKRNEDGIASATAVIERRSQDLFDVVWARISTNDALDPAKRTSLKAAVKASDWPACLDGSTSKAQARTCFTSSQVVASQRRALANASK